jgi:hypothetical protein
MTGETDPRREPDDEGKELGYRNVDEQGQHDESPGSQGPGAEEIDEETDDE